MTSVSQEGHRCEMGMFRNFAGEIVQLVNAVGADASNYDSSSNAVVIECPTGGKVWVQCLGLQTNECRVKAGHYNTFSGMLLSATGTN